MARTLQRLLWEEPRLPRQPQHRHAREPREPRGEESSINRSASSNTSSDSSSQNHSIVLRVFVVLGGPALMCAAPEAAARLAATVFARRLYEHLWPKAQRFAGVYAARPWAVGRGGPTMAAGAAEAPFLLTTGFDPHGFLEDVKAARDAVGEPAEADARHLEGIVSFAAIAGCLGHVLVFIGTAFPFGTLPALACLAGALGICAARSLRWTTIGHHVCHGGFDRLQQKHPGMLPTQYKRGVFATGARRFIDWLDVQARRPLTCSHTGLWRSSVKLL